MRRPMGDDNICRLGYCVDMSRRLVDQYASIICNFFAANFTVTHTAALAIKRKCGGSSCLLAKVSRLRHSRMTEQGKRRIQMMETSKIASTMNTTHMECNM